MAIVTSDERITVIILESKAEVNTLTELLEKSWAMHRGQLDELTNALVGMA